MIGLDKFELSTLSPKEIKNLEYNKLIDIIKTLSTSEFIELSKRIGYPVFTRLCMGELNHTFVLLQDGASAIIENEFGQILLQSRSDRDMWGLPGGCQELGERFEDTIIREVKEETNFDCLEEDLELISVVSGYSRMNQYSNGDVVINNSVLYLIRKYSGNLKWDNESKEMKFFDLDKLPQNLMDRDLIDVYINYLNNKHKTK